MTDASGTVAEFVYDADGGRLIRRDHATGKTSLYWGGHTELTLTTATGVVTPLRYYSFNGQVIAVRDGKFQNNVTTLISDHHGSATRAIANTTGTLTIRRFDPYGVPRGAVPAWKGDHGFVNGPTDLTLGLTHLGAREYDPVVGRFLSVDPLVDPLNPQTLNAYAYANNSPVTFTDPDGLALFEGSKRGGTGIVVPDGSKKSIASAKKQQKARVAKAAEAEHRIMNRHKNGRPLGKGAPSRPVAKTPTPKPNRGGPMDFLGGVLDSAASIVDFGAQGAQLMNPVGAGAYLVGFRARPGRAACDAIDSVAGFDHTTGAYRSGNRTVNGLSWVAGLGGAARGLASMGAKTAQSIPAVIYRAGGKSPSNFRLRPGENALSFRDSLSDPMSPVRPVFTKDEYVGIDTSQLPWGSGVPDGVPGSVVTPPGHVSVYVDDPLLLKAAIIEFGRFPK